MATYEQQGRFWDVWDTRAGSVAYGYTSACLSVRKNPIARHWTVTGHCDRAAGRHRECPPTVRHRTYDEHAWADRPRIHSGIDIQHAITGHTTPVDNEFVGGIYT